MKLILKLLGWLFLLFVVAMGSFIALNWESERSVDELKARWAQPPSQFMNIEGMQIHLRDEGPRDDTLPIVLLHGTSASLHTWDGWANALTDKHRVIRFDLPAFGLTGPSPDNNYTIENYAHVVATVLDQLQVERCIIAGNSLGGYIAWATALLHEEKIDKLVLIDSSGYPFTAKSVPIAFKIASTPVVNKLMKNVLPRSIVESSLNNVYGDSSLISTDLVDRYFELATRAGNRQALVERFKQTQPGQLASRVSELKLPTLILWGERDHLIPIDSGERFHKEISGSKFVSFEKLGHVPHEEDPESTVAAFKEFLSQQN